MGQTKIPQLRFNERFAGLQSHRPARARSDGAEKVTGKAVYTVDVDLPGMAHAKVLRSPYPHARIVRVDSSKAERLPGVYAVITKEDQRELGMFGAAYKDQTIVAVDKVRYVGDPVAAVAAVDEATAEGSVSADRCRIPGIAGSVVHWRKHWHRARCWFTIRRRWAVS